MFQTFILHKGARGWSHSIVKPNWDFLKPQDRIANAYTAVVVQIDDGELVTAEKGTEEQISFFSKGQYRLDDEIGGSLDQNVNEGHRLFVMRTHDGRWLYRFMRRKGDYWRMSIEDIPENYVVDIQEDPDDDCALRFTTSVYYPSGTDTEKKREREFEAERPPPKKPKTVSLEYSFNAMNDFVTQSDIRAVMEYQNKAYLPKSSPSTPPPLKPKMPETIRPVEHRSSVTTQLVDLEQIRREVITEVNDSARQFIASGLILSPQVSADQKNMIKRSYIESSMSDQSRIDDETTKKVDSVKNQIILFQRYLESSDTITEKKRKECKKRLRELIRESESIMLRYQKLTLDIKERLDWRIKCLDDCVSPASYFVSSSYY